MMVFSDSPIIVEQKSLREQNDFILANKEPREPLVSSPSTHPVIEEKTPSSSTPTNLTNQAQVGPNLSVLEENLNRRKETLATALKVSLITIGVYLVYTKILK